MSLQLIHGLQVTVSLKILITFSTVSSPPLGTAIQLMRNLALQP